MADMPLVSGRGTEFRKESALYQGFSYCVCPTLLGGGVSEFLPPPPLVVKKDPALYHSLISAPFALGAQ